MRALRISAVNQLEVVEVPAPHPGVGEVLVDLKAASLNRRDAWIKSGEYAGVTFPCFPGSDGAGVVSALGEGTDPHWLGRDVILNPGLDWGGSEKVQAATFSILGLPHAGTLAERIVVPAGQLAVRPAHLSWVEAAALPLAGLTAYRTVMVRAQLQAGERVLISGVGGGAALFAMQFAVALGAEVWVTSSSEEKIARAVSLGAIGGFNYTTPGALKAAAKSPGRFDVIVDSAGGKGFDQLVDVAAPGARIAFFGATLGNPPLLPMRKIFWRQLSLLGSTMGSPADWAAMTAFVALHRLKPVVSEVFPLERAAEAFALMERGGQFGKIVVEIV